MTSPVARVDVNTDLTEFLLVWVSLYSSEVQQPMHATAVLGRH